MRRAAIFVTASLIATFATADIAPETLFVNTLDVGDRGLIVNGFDGRVMIFNAATREMKGMLSLGDGVSAIEWNEPAKRFYSAETYLSRHTRGTRTDVVSTWDMTTLNHVGEVAIPSTKSGGMPHREYTGLLDDGRFMIVNHVSPGISVSVVDVVNQRFAGAIETAGCALIYPVDNHAFLQLCGDGSLQLIRLNDDGTERDRQRSKRFFSVNDNPVSEQAVRVGDTWLFATFEGAVFEATVSGKKIKVRERYELAATAPGWRPGGLQTIDHHDDSHTLVTLMHEGGVDTHKDPGTEVWLFDSRSGALRHRLKLPFPMNAITVSQGESPQLYAASMGNSDIHVFDLETTRLLHKIENAHSTPTLLQVWQR